MSVTGRTLVIILAIVWTHASWSRSRQHRILLFPSPFYSHSASVYAIGRELMEQGHEVHMLQHWSFKIPEAWTEDGKMAVHRYGRPEQGGHSVEEYLGNMVLDFTRYNFHRRLFLDKMQQLSRSFIVEMLTENDELMEKLGSIKFDLAVIDSTTYMKFNCLVPHRLGIPMITYTDAIDPWLVRMPWLPSIYSPGRMSANSSDSFFARFSNLLYYAHLKFYPNSPTPDEKLLNEYRRYGVFGSLEEIISRSLLFLLPSDPTLDVVRPCTANVIFVGGLTTDLIKTSQTMTLPKEYLRFIDDARPTIVVSFGSVIYWYPEKLVATLVETFRLLPEYKFIWKYPNDDQPAVPENVMLAEWLPHSQLLTRTEVKLFITHSGNNVQFEALYHAVPMLTVPIYADQVHNAERIVERGFGEQIDHWTATPGLIAELIRKIVNDPSYSVRIKKASDAFKDQPQTPSQRAAFWINHVIRHGAEHLRPAGNDLRFWQYLCLDVLVFCIVVSVLLLCLSSVLAKYSIRWLFQQRESPTTTSKKLE